MASPKYIENLPFLAEFLKRDILPEFDLNWTEFLILSLVHQFEQNDIYPSPQKIIAILGMNRGYTEPLKSFIRDPSYPSGKANPLSLGIFILLSWVESPLDALM